MAQTPEGKVKRKVSALLMATPELWYDMPVPGGYGRASLDYVGGHRGAFFSIETKAPGKKPTDRQTNTISRMQAAKGVVFVIDGDLSELAEWLSRDEPKPSED